MKINLITAVGNNNVIGKDNKLPWKLAEDMYRFKELTMGHTVVMGRKTYESIGQPLPGRINIVISSGKPIKGCIVIKDPSTIKHITTDEIFVIGGQQIYEHFLPIADNIFMTHIFEDFDGDSFFPELDLTQWDEVEYTEGECKELCYGFSKYVRKGY